jgi:hypothetical protein
MMKMSEKSQGSVYEQRERTSFGSPEGAHRTTGGAPEERRDVGVPKTLVESPRHLTLLDFAYFLSRAAVADHHSLLFKRC